MTINGVEYEQRIISSTVKPHLSAYVSAMLMLYGGMHGRMSRKKDLPVKDFITEYELIQLKQSKLRRSERESIIREFNKYFKIKE